jgi:hypothetical protein
VSQPGWQAVMLAGRGRTGMMVGEGGTTGNSDIN